MLATRLLGVRDLWPPIVRDQRNDEYIAMRRPRRVERLDRCDAVRDSRVVEKDSVEWRGQREGTELSAVERVI